MNDPANVSQGTKESNSELSKVNYVFLVAIGIGLVAINFFGKTSADKATIVLWAVASLSIGALVGLLFGIPRMRQPYSKSATGMPHDNKIEGKQVQPEINNNLIEVSDWLTKIIVGLGLVELNQLPNKIKIIIHPLVKSIDNEQAEAISSAVLLLFVSVGFLAAYINARTVIAVMFRRSDDKLLDDSHGLTPFKAMEVNDFTPSFENTLNQILSDDVVQILANNSKPEEVRKVLQEKVNNVTDDIFLKSFISIDLTDFGKDYTTREYPIAALKDINSLTDAVYYALQDQVRPYAYRIDWILRKKENKEIIKNMRMLTNTPVGVPVSDPRPLESLGIKAGMKLEALKVIKDDGSDI